MPRLHPLCESLDVIGIAHQMAQARRPILLSPERIGALMGLPRGPDRRSSAHGRRALSRDRRLRRRPRRHLALRLGLGLGLRLGLGRLWRRRADHRKQLVLIDDRRAELLRLLHLAAGDGYAGLGIDAAQHVRGLAADAARDTPAVLDDERGCLLALQRVLCARDHKRLVGQAV
eukprot:6590913-Prymnesium_polylepis.1